MGIKDFARASLPNGLWQKLRFWRFALGKARRDRKFLYDRYFRRHVEGIYPSIIATGETTNFTYDLTPTSLLYLAETIGAALKVSSVEVERYISEAIADADINERALALTPSVSVRSPFGRRLGWYAVARILKPSVIVETGVDRGHGSLILCAALLRNAAEGKPGRYFGTDLRPEAGQLLDDKYAEVGRILVGDSIASLSALNETIDLFINDSDHSADYEYREYETVFPKLSERAVILGDNAHFTDKLARFSREKGRRFLFFKEDPLNHWYIGAGIGISVPQ